MHSILIFLKQEEGSTAIEYLLLASLLALIPITGFSLLGFNIKETFNFIEGQLSPITVTEEPKSSLAR